MAVMQCSKVFPTMLSDSFLIPNAPTQELPFGLASIVHWERGIIFRDLITQEGSILTETPRFTSLTLLYSCVVLLYTCITAKFEFTQNYET